MSTMLRAARYPAGYQHVATPDECAESEDFRRETVRFWNWIMPSAYPKLFEREGADHADRPEADRPE